MLIVSPECDTSWPDGLLPCPLGDPWSVRLAGARSGRPAIELYEAGDLVDVISSTTIARRLLRGARAAGPEAARTDAAPRAIAWGRLPAGGSSPAVVFSGPLGRDARAAAVIVPVSWCWIAVADGRFARVTVRTPDEALRRRLARRLPWC